ncbi:sugar porter (SP) family MFS transporter [Jatrophihabitans sp. GAS493]|uniref:sugar porter family MFS transporter n=1 Tax=Jatrophihabitans sp. GAS493 TaxID=1907575 RepID=UPI000BB746AC|nr:sugar porter family MFS transporter [Jatrophihabitans sp. GAS493]SOD74559.1 sugar porter (SP) family MFS transporter [Jatrophihabitans sp. GAS493]
MTQSDQETSTRLMQQHRNVVTRAAALTAVGGVLFGYDTGVVGGVLPNIASQFNLTNPFQKGLVVAILLAGAAVGALIAGRLADQLGRRRAILITSIVFVIGLLLSSLAPALWVFWISRFIIGLGVGSTSFVVPLYIGEIAPPERRGALVSLNQLSVTVGILVSQLVAYFLAGHGDWRVSVGLALLPAIILGLGVLQEPESPAWLVRQDREDEARTVLATMRDSEQAIDDEVEKIREVAQEERKGSIGELLDNRLRPALILGVSLAIIQQITGINTVIYFAPTVLQEAGLGSSASLLALVVVGVVNVVLTLVAIRYLDRLGRRPLLIWGMVGMTAGLVALALAFAIGIHGAGAVFATAALAFYVGAFAVSLGPIVWLLIAEIFPLRVRGQAASIATMSNWAANLVVAVSYLSIISAIGETGTFISYAVVTALSLIYVVKKVPETNGLTLSQIEAELNPSGTAAPETGKVGAITPSG